MVVELKQVDFASARAATLRAHGLPSDAEDDVLIVEALRRAASLRCPASSHEVSELVRATLEPLVQLSDDTISDALDQIVGIGDLVEVQEQVGHLKRRLLYLGEPRFVRRASGDLLLLGIRPDAVDLVPESISERLTRVGVVRRLEEVSDDDLENLNGLGLSEVSAATWIGHPPSSTAAHFAASFDRRLDAQGPSGDIADLRILDHERSVHYYKGRWRTADAGTTGRFVGRRRQQFGADLWCYVELDGGVPARLLDLPLNHDVRGCDEAWQLQAAFDDIAGHPQSAVVARTGRGRVLIGLPSPPPRWLQRRWELLGEPCTLRGSLLAFEFATRDLKDELAFIHEQLWMNYRIATEEG